MTSTLNLQQRADERAEDRRIMHELLAELRAQRAQSTDLVHQVASQLRNDVLWSGTMPIGSDGWGERDARGDYAAAMVTNATTSTVTVTSNPPASGPPSQGAGVHVIPAGTFAVVNMAGNSLTVYGTAGTKVSVQLFTKPQPPTAGSIALVDVGGTERVSLYGRNLNAGDTSVAVAGSTGRLLVATGQGATSLTTLQGATGPAATVDMTVGFATYAMSTVVVGAPATCTVNLEGSHDAVTWYVLGTSNSTTGDLTSVTGKPCRYLRANVTALTSGTVTVRVTPA